ncbi:MAG: PAS-domain containing protein [Rhodopila sp.]
MKPDKHLRAAGCTGVAAVLLIALTWIGTIRTISAQQLENTDRVTATLASQALTFAEQINRHILALDQTLRLLVTSWESDPGRFDLEAWRDRAFVLNGRSRDMVLTDESGIIRQSSVSEAINQNVSGLGYFRALADQPNAGKTLTDGIYIGPATLVGVLRQWHMNVARALHHRDGSFAGVIDADYRIAAITDIVGQPDLGIFVTLAGLDDGRLRAKVGPSAIDPDADVGDTTMFAAIRETGSGVWTGPSAGDAVRRIHAFRRLPGRNLAVVVAMSEEEAMRPATVWRQQADLFAGCITALLAGLALVLVQGTRLARRREASVAEDRAILAASNSQMEFARAVSAAKAEQLEATLAGMSDGVSLIDAQMRLVEWNARFPEIAGVPAEILRVGLPMEDILHAQIRTGQFGTIADPEAEVDRRMAHLLVAPFGVTQRRRPDGRTLELRRNRLPDGGFVTLYSDITEHKLAEEALRRATAAAENANSEKSRFVAIVSHEIRTPLNALLNTVRLLSDSVLAPGQQSLLAPGQQSLLAPGHQSLLAPGQQSLLAPGHQSLLAPGQQSLLAPAQRSLLLTARRSGDALFGLINDILDLSQMEAGKLSIRPSLFELRPLLESSAEMFTAHAAERGITIRVTATEGTPETLLTDPGRLRQVLLNLVSNAVKYARPGEVWLTAEPGLGPLDAVRLTVRDGGPVIAPDARARLFHPFARLDRPEGNDQAGTGLGLSICHHLVTLLGGAIGCEVWRPGQGGPREGVPGQPGDGRSDNEREGNAFWLALPATALPFRSAPDEAGFASGMTGEASSQRAAPAIDKVPARPKPRTRILLAEDIVANQLVATTLLRREGHHVDVAASGPAAIQAIQAAPYDLVFMDIFMPGMSGQEATQIIRTLPEPARSTPIVALTANVGPQDEALFKAAGMDGFLGKPVRLSELLDVLDRHVWSAKMARAPTGALQAAPVRQATGRPVPSRPGDSRIMPILAADRIDELRSNLPTDTFTNLIEECLVDMNHRLPALRRALAAGAPAAITAHAHALVGMASGYGMAAMEARLRTIIAAAREGDMASLGPAVTAALASDFIDTARTLREMVRSEVV